MASLGLRPKSMALVTGLRLSELVGLNVSNVSPDGQEIQ